MLGMLKGMDNATIKSMMAMQGMNLSDDQIAMMKNNMSPDTLKMMKDGKMRPPMGNFSNPSNFPGNSSPDLGINGVNPNTSSTNISNNMNTPLNSQMNTPSPTMSGMPKGFPDMNNMDLSSMLKFVQDNPQIMNMMGPQMSQMFGGGQGGANGATAGPNGMNNDMMMKSMQNILWLMTLPSRIKAFFTSTRGLLFIGLIVILIIAYYKN